MDQEKLAGYWVESSDLDYETMLSLYETKHYNWSLFVGHLVIEKLLKGLYMQVNHEHPPLIHNLLRLAQKSGIGLDPEQEMFFAEVTEFNINVRYEDYKMDFYRKCSKEYTEEWIEKIKHYRQWIKMQLLK